MASSSTDIVSTDAVSTETVSADTVLSLRAQIKGTSAHNYPLANANLILRQLPLPLSSRRGRSYRCYCHGRRRSLLGHRHRKEC
jgi:hypothetical protein